MKYFILSLSAVLLFAASCSKVSTPVTQQDWLREGKWKISSATATSKTYPAGVKHTYTDSILFNSTNCKSDNYLVFGNNNGGTAFTGSNKCYASEPDNQNFYWELVNNGNTMNIYNADLFFGIPSVAGTVTKLARSSFTVQYSYFVTYPDPSNKFRTINDTVSEMLNMSNN